MKIIERVEQLKRHMASSLNAVLNKLSLKARKRLLLISGCMVTCLCAWMLLSPFHRGGVSVNVFQNGRISAPVVPPEPLFSAEDINMLRDFRQVMDSLKLYDAKTYTEILQGHEDLLDSVDMLLRWYE